MGSEYYTRDFYERLRTGAFRSAEIVAPLVLQLLPVKSVVDVGCGDGAWLAAFRKLGVTDILGIDGDYVERDLLQIPSENFRSMDLSRPVSLEREFDLAISLEVAEHLPAESSSLFVEFLTAAAPMVMFSAAIPHQGGDNHINERWAEEWAELFEQRGYAPVDYIRRRIWKNEAVEYWYAQNILLYVRRDILERNSILEEEFNRTDPAQLSIIHPRQYLYLENRFREAVQNAAPLGPLAASRHLMVCLKSALRRRLSGRG